MPRYIVARKLSLLNGDFTITDQDTGRGCFRVHGKGLLNPRLSFHDLAGEEHAFIEQRGLSQIYEIHRSGETVARIHPTSAIRRRLAVETQDNGTIYVTGNIAGLEYLLARDGAAVATVSTVSTPVAGAHTADIADTEDQALMLAVVVTIEAIQHQAQG
jgi:uncharacterized protein YxjI